MIRLGIGMGAFRRPAAGGGEVDPETASAVVAGAGEGSLNGTYARTGSRNGRPHYVHSLGVYVVTWETDGYWSIADVGFSSLYYYSQDDVDFPWLATTWEAGDADEPVPTVTAG
jgi:hypothetical protein